VSIELADSLVPLAAELVGTSATSGPRTSLPCWPACPTVATTRSPSCSRPWSTRTSGSALGRHAERRAEVARLTNLGMSAEAIGERLGITKRAVTRHRQAIREALEVAS
jgi:DNA-binding NarL/FixJ family response regulator